MSSPEKGRGPLRNGTPSADALETTTPQSTPSPDSWEAFRGVRDPEQQFSLWRLCPCADCGGTGKRAVFSRITYAAGYTAVRCPYCRGEGRVLQLVATCATPEAVGVALVTLGLEGEWDECPVGVMRQNEVTGKGQWVLKPWLPSPRNVSDAGRLLQQQRS